MSLVMLAIALLMGFWCIINLKRELRMFRLVTSGRASGFTVGRTVKYLIAVPMHIAITVGIVAVFSFGAGIIGAIATLFMSNLISMLFFGDN